MTARARSQNVHNLLREGPSVSESTATDVLRPHSLGSDGQRVLLSDHRARAVLPTATDVAAGVAQFQAVGASRLSPRSATSEPSREVSEMQGKRTVQTSCPKASRTEA